jgi:hypothetical protein
MTDRYGDLPYFEALQGNSQPVFDTQEAIYTDLFKELKEAAAQFDTGDPAKGDILFDGDITAWKKFANSLRLILALRISGVSASAGEAQFDDVMNNLGSNGGIITDNSENVDLDYPGAAFKNPWFGIGGDFAVCLTIADYLYNYGDRRADAFGHSGFEGFTYGLPRQDAVDESNNKDWSLILADAFRGEAGTITILSYADILLARAEAAARGWTAENATVLYDEAVQASWEQWGVFDATAYATYITEDLGSATMLEKIAIQRWITFYPNSPQGYSEWRRTGFPALTPSPAPLNNSGQIPVRYIYPTAEYNLNGTNLGEAVGRLSGGDTQDSKLWWDNN